MCIGSSSWSTCGTVTGHNNDPLLCTRARGQINTPCLRTQHPAPRQLIVMTWRIPHLVAFLIAQPLVRASSAGNLQTGSIMVSLPQLFCAVTILISTSLAWAHAPHALSTGRPSPSPSPSYPHPPLPQYASAPGSVPAPGWLPPGHLEQPHASPMPSSSPAWASNYSLPPEEYDLRQSPPRRGLLPGDMRPPTSSLDSRGWTPESTLMTEYGSERHGPSWSSAYRPATSAADSGWGSKDPVYREPRPHTAGYGDWDRMHTSPRSGRPWSSSESDSHTRSWSSHGTLYTHAPSSMTYPSPLPLTASPVSTSPHLYPDSAFPERMSTTSHYSRVLVGSMGAVCQRLKDLDGEPGLFFFAHDLGIRTEGTFSLRFTLVDLTV